MSATNPKIQTFIYFILLVGTYTPPLSAQEKGYETIEKGDYAAAFRELMPLAEKDDPMAQFVVGLLYNTGQGVAQDQTNAAKWYLKAAQQNYPAAQVYLGLLYQTEKNYTEAVRWFKAAAEQGEMNASVYLALLYLQGEGVPKDSTAAAQWLEQASWRGNTQAMGMYAALLFGSFVKEKSEKNLVEAHAWSHLAAELDFIQTMLTTRVLIAMYMNEEQRADGEKFKKELNEKVIENRKRQLEVPAFIIAQNLFAKAI